MTKQSPATVHRESRLEFRLVELPKGANHHYAVVSCRVEALTGRLLGYGWLWHADTKGFCTSDILHIGLGHAKFPKLPLRTIEADFFEKLLPALKLVEVESHEIVSLLVEGYARAKGHLDLWGATFTDYLWWQQDFTPERLKERKWSPQKHATMLYALRETLPDFRNLFRFKGQTAFMGPFNPPFGPPRITFLSKAMSKLKNYDVRWQSGLFWDLNLGPAPHLDLQMVWRFNCPKRRAVRTWKQIAKRVLQDYWIVPYNTDWYNRSVNHSKAADFQGQPLSEIGLKGIALVLGVEVGHTVKGESGINLP